MASTTVLLSSPIGPPACRSPSWNNVFESNPLPPSSDDDDYHDFGAYNSNIHSQDDHDDDNDNDNDNDDDLNLLALPPNSQEDASGLLSPSFDASFASSMSLSSTNTGNMDISPMPDNSGGLGQANTSLSSTTTSGSNTSLNKPSEKRTSSAFDSSFFAKLASNQPSSSRSRKHPSPDLPPALPSGHPPVTSSPESVYPDSPSDYRRTTKPIAGTQRVFGSNLNPNRVAAANQALSNITKEALSSTIKANSSPLAVCTTISSNSNSHSSTTTTTTAATTTSAAATTTTATASNNDVRSINESNLGNNKVDNSDNNSNTTLKKPPPGFSSSKSSHLKPAHHRALSDGITLKTTKRPRDHPSRHPMPPPPLHLSKQQNLIERSPISCPPTNATTSRASSPRQHFSGQGNWAQLDVFGKRQQQQQQQQQQQPEAEPHNEQQDLQQFSTNHQYLLQHQYQQEQLQLPQEQQPHFIHSPAPMDLDSSPHPKAAAAGFFNGKSPASALSQSKASHLFQVNNAAATSTSPAPGSSPNSSFLAEAFNDPSPIPAAKKRLLHSLGSTSPTNNNASSSSSIDLADGSPAPMASRGYFGSRRPQMEKAVTLSHFGHQSSLGSTRNAALSNFSSVSTSSRAGRFPKRPSLANVFPNTIDSSSSPAAVPSLPSQAQNGFNFSSSTPSHSSILAKSGRANLSSGFSGENDHIHNSSGNNNGNSNITEKDYSPLLPPLADLRPAAPTVRFKSDTFTGRNFGGNNNNNNGFHFDNDDDQSNADTSFGRHSSPLRSSPSGGFQFASESEGKILPCFSVKDDGLMRIKPNTLSDLLEGRYDGLIARYIIVDCRFEYEYEGGHFRGAINLPTTEAVEQYLLQQGSGLYADSGSCLPPPSKSGEPDSDGNIRKTVLVFHCEFSTKRAPTLAKHLRQLDRKINSKVYPRVHYPDVYILAGGYEQSFKHYPQLCDPCGYRPMDDPEFLAKRSADLNEFRKTRIGCRAKSFTFGERGGNQQQQQQQINQQQQQHSQNINNKNNDGYIKHSRPTFQAAKTSTNLIAAMSQQSCLDNNNTNNNNSSNFRRQHSHNRTISNVIAIRNPTIEEEGEISLDADESSFSATDSPCPPGSRPSRLSTLG